MVHIVGTLTMILAVAMALIALPRQIVKNHRENRVGIDAWIIMLSFGVYSLRAVYGFLIESYYIMIPDVTGAFFSSVLIFQVFVRPRLSVLERMERWKLI